MKILPIALFSLFCISSSAQENNPPNAKKLISEKSFAFVSTTLFKDKSQKSYNPHKTYSDNDISTMPFDNYNGKVKVAGLTDRMLLVEDIPSMANQMPSNISSEVPVISIDKNSAFLNYAILNPKFYELVGTEPIDLTSPMAYSNYTVKQLKNGKIKIRFNFEDNGIERQAFLTVLPNGVSDLTLSSKSIRNMGWEKTYFKGYITQI